MLSKCSTTTKLTQAKRLGFLPCLKAGHLQAQTVKPLQKSEYRLSSQKKKKKREKNRHTLHALYYKNPHENLSLKTKL